jgi:hypothetical protein
MGLTDVDGMSQMAAGWGANIIAAYSAVKHSLAGSLRHSLGPKVRVIALLYSCQSRLLPIHLVLLL